MQVFSLFRVGISAVIGPLVLQRVGTDHVEFQIEKSFALSEEIVVDRADELTFAEAFIVGNSLVEREVVFGLKLVVVVVFDQNNQTFFVADVNKLAVLNRERLDNLIVFGRKNFSANNEICCAVFSCGGDWRLRGVFVPFHRSFYSSSAQNRFSFCAEPDRLSSANNDRIHRPRVGPQPSFRRSV